MLSSRSPAALRELQPSRTAPRCCYVTITGPEAPYCGLTLTGDTVLTSNFLPYPTSP
jgi:hypothetical protein